MSCEQCLKTTTAHVLLLWPGAKRRSLICAAPAGGPQTLSLQTPVDARWWRGSTHGLGQCASFTRLRCCWTTFRPCHGPCRPRQANKSSSARPLLGSRRERLLGTEKKQSFIRSWNKKTRVWSTRRLAPGHASVRQHVRKKALRNGGRCAQTPNLASCTRPFTTGHRSRSRCAEHWPAEPGTVQPLASYTV